MLFRLLGTLSIVFCPYQARDGAEPQIDVVVLCVRGTSHCLRLTPWPSCSQKNLMRSLCFDFLAFGTPMKLLQLGLVCGLSLDVAVPRVAVCDLDSLYTDKIGRAHV